MGNKIVWVVVVILAMVGLYYWSMAEVEVMPAVEEVAPVAQETATESDPGVPTEVPVSNSEVR